jgi:hypothetical protein
MCGGTRAKRRDVDSKPCWSVYHSQPRIEHLHTYLNGTCTGCMQEQPPRDGVPDTDSWPNVFRANPDGAPNVDTNPPKPGGVEGGGVRPARRNPGARHI